MNLRFLSNEQLSAKIKILVREERRITVEILHHLREFERRMLHAEAGHSTLMAYCVSELKFSESAANRRIQAMRMLKQVPEIQSKLESGQLNLTTLTLAASYIRRSDKDQKNPTSVEEKKELLKEIENLSTRDAERLLAEKKPESKPVVEEKKRAISGGRTRVTMVLDKALIEKVEELQKLLGRKYKIKELVALMVDEKLVKLRKQRGVAVPVENHANANREKGRAKKNTATAKTPTKTTMQTTTETAPKMTATDKPDSLVEQPSGRPSLKVEVDAKVEAHVEAKMEMKKGVEEKNFAPCATGAGVYVESAAFTKTKQVNKRGYLSVALKRQLWQRSQGRCEYIDLRSGKRCDACFHLEIDHIQAIALGGSDELENLQILCRTHNQLRAVQTFGQGKMAQFVTSLR